MRVTIENNATANVPELKKTDLLSVFSLLNYLYQNYNKNILT